MAKSRQTWLFDTKARTRTSPELQRKTFQSSSRSIRQSYTGSMEEDEDDFYGGGGQGMQHGEDPRRMQEYTSKGEQMDVSEDQEEEDEEEDSDDVWMRNLRNTGISVDHDI